jgi:hypothetical protein
VIGRILSESDREDLLLKAMADAEVAAPVAAKAPVEKFRDPIWGHGRGVGPKDTRPLKPRAMNRATPDDELLDALKASLKPGKPTGSLDEQAKYFMDPANIDEPGVLEMLLQATAEYGKKRR